MSLQTSLVISVILGCCAGWLLWNFFQRRITAGQTIFWLTLMTGAEILTLFPRLVDSLAVLWGDLWPVSWITFLALTAVVFYLLYLTVRLNRVGRVNDLARSVGQLERRLRRLEQAQGRSEADEVPPES